MREIKITQGRTVLVDDEDYEKLAKYSWSLHKAGAGKEYAKRGLFRGNKTILMHREVTGAIPGSKVDHINGNGLDNRKCNLRICDSHENSWNSKPHRSPNRKGIYYNKRDKVWIANIRVRGKRIHLGTFKTEDGAMEVYRKASLKYHGDFSYFARIKTDSQPANDPAFVARSVEDVMEAGI